MSTYGGKTRWFYGFYTVCVPKSRQRAIIFTSPARKLGNKTIKRVSKLCHVFPKAIEKWRISAKFNGESSFAENVFDKLRIFLAGKKIFQGL